MEELNAAKAEAFGGRMLGLLNDSMLSLAVSIGHRAKLFDKLAEIPPSTSEEIARRTELNERYVREWLGAMVTAKIIEYDAGKGNYFLPREHAPMLTRAAGPDNMAAFTQYVALLAGVEDRILECFHRGGGVPYSAYGKFQELQAEESAQVHDRKLISTILPLVPNSEERLQAGIDVLDVGCGAGHAVNLIAQAYPKSRVTGYDFSEEGVALGRAEAKRLGLSNSRHEARDVTKLGVAGGFDLITAFDTIHDQAEPAKVLRSIYDALRPGGWFLCVDIASSSDLAENIDHPFGPALYTVSTFHCMTVSLAQGGAGLGTMWGEQKAKQMLAEAGFPAPTVTRVDGDMFNYYYLAQKG